MNRRIADNVVSVSTPLDVSFFEAWLDFISPLHGMTKSERSVVANYLNSYYKLSKAVLDDALIARILMSTESKQEIMEACGLKASNLQVILTKLKKRGIFTNGRIDPRLIPDISPEVEESGEFRLMIRFQIKHDS